MIANVALLALAVAWLGWRARPPSGAVRLRNAMLVDEGRRADFEWTPDGAPAGFRRERRAPDPLFVGVVRSLPGASSGSEWDRARLLAAHLLEHARDAGPVRAGLRATYDGIRQGRGYCADFAKVFVALAHAAAIDVRQWGFSFDGFGGHGHTVVEVFDRTRGRWLFLDVYNNLHAQDDASGEPLGVLDYRDALLGLRGGATLVANGPGRPGFVHAATALDYYRRGLDQWYLLWGNAVYSYDGHPLVRALGSVSRTLAEVGANAVRLQPRLRIVATRGNATQFRQMLALRRELTLLAGVIVLLVLALAVQLAIGAHGQRPVS
jgi:hypothetical protein